MMECSNLGTSTFRSVAVGPVSIYPLVHGGSSSTLFLVFIYHEHRPEMTNRACQPDRFGRPMSDVLASAGGLGVPVNPIG